MKTIFLCVGITVLLVFSRAFAQTPHESRPPRLLNPKNIGNQPHHLDINADVRRDGSYRFTMTIRVKDVKFPLEDVSGYLRIQDGDKLVCGCPLKADSDEASEWFKFDVAAAYTRDSRFSLLIFAANAEDRKKLSSASGWTSYEFTLKDFVVENEITSKTPVR